MNFLNVGPLELTVVLIIAILLIGPRRMVEVTRTIGRVTGQLRRFSDEFISSLQTEVMVTERKPGQPPENVFKSLTEPITSLQDELLATGRETRQALANIVEGKSGAIEIIQETARETHQYAPETGAGSNDPKDANVTQNDANPTRED